ncbi:uroporphyrinogen decarboxylase family protein [Chloroflexota bacterium]
MNSRERITALIAREATDRCGLWLGNPDSATWPILHDYFGTKTEEELRIQLGDDFRWCAPDVHVPAYFHPAGRAMFDLEAERVSLSQAGPLADCEDPAELDRYEWPSLEHLDFSATIDQLRSYTTTYRASGFWTPFYHNVMDLLGMESYLIKMYTHPEVVHAITDRVCQFYYDANELFFAAIGNDCEAFFFGNDFGTQRDLIMSPALFDEFVMPWFKTFTAQGHRHGKQVILHSCGSIYKVIPRLIEAEVDCLHPLQAQAANMEAVRLADEFGGQITFLGGIDAQGILPHGTPEEVRAEVKRVRDLLGPHVIISPSHEAILPDVPPQNVQALAEAALIG